MFRYGPYLRVMELINGGKKHVPPPERESYAVKLAKAEATKDNRCPATTKAGKPCEGKVTADGYCQWHAP